MREWRDIERDLRAELAGAHRAGTMTEALGSVLREVARAYLAARWGGASQAFRGDAESRFLADFSRTWTYADPGAEPLAYVQAAIRNSAGMVARAEAARVARETAGAAAPYRPARPDVAMDVAELEGLAALAERLRSQAAAHRAACRAAERALKLLQRGVRDAYR